jgi:hypothetical protein
MKTKLTKLLSNYKFQQDFEVLKNLEGIDCTCIDIIGRHGAKIQLDGDEPEFKALNLQIKKMKKRWAKMIEDNFNNNIYNL